MKHPKNIPKRPRKWSQNRWFSSQEDARRPQKSKTNAENWFQSLTRSSSRGAWRVIFLVHFFDQNLHPRKNICFQQLFGFLRASRVLLARKSTILGPFSRSFWSIFWMCYFDLFLARFLTCFSMFCFMIFSIVFSMLRRCFFKVRTFTKYCILRYFS